MSNMKYIFKPENMEGERVPLGKWEVEHVWKESKDRNIVSEKVCAERESGDWGDGDVG